MNRQRRDIDEELGAALRARARTGDGDLLWQIMRNVDALPQARRGRWADGLRLTPSISYVILLALLGAAIVGALAVASITRPDPLPASFENGVIVVSDGGIAAMRAIEPATGEAVPAEELDLPEGAGAAWAVDGSRYAYVHEHQIMVRDLATKASRVVGRCATDFRCDLSWSPDGEWVAVADLGLLQLLNSDSGEVREVAAQPSGRDSRVLSPTWSPDGRSIAFSSGRHIFTVSRDGSQLTEIATEPFGAKGQIALAWSPDGSQIAYVGTEPGSVEELWPLGIYLVNPDGSNHRKLRDVGECFCGGGWFGPGIAWSPDGTQIAFTTVGYNGPSSEPSGGLYVMDATGGEPRLLSRNAASNPAWQPVPGQGD